MGIVTPGGVAPGLNTVIHGIVNMHAKVYRTSKEFYGFVGGFRGLVRREFKLLTPDNTREWVHSGGTGLRTSRPRQNVQEMANALVDLGVNILYVVGGDGSLSGAHELATLIEQKRMQVRELGIVIAGMPKTMDNDILWVWHSFGFDTAVEEATKAINAIHDDTQATERVCLLQLFGRDAGFVTAHAGLASGRADVVLIPEVPFRLKPLLDYVQDVLTSKGYALIVVAEGAAPKEYSEDFIHDRLEKELGLRKTDQNYKTHPQVTRAIAAGKLTYLEQKFNERFVTGSPSGGPPFHEGRHQVNVIQPRHLN